MLLPQTTLIDWPAQWRGRERFTVFDAYYGDGAQFDLLVKAWQDDPARPRHLHVIALERNAAMPGLFRMPQDAAGLTLDLLALPGEAGQRQAAAMPAQLAQSLGQLLASFDAVCLRDLQGDEWVRPLSRLCKTGTTLFQQGLRAEQLDALAAAGFGPNGFATRKPARPLPPHAHANGPPGGAVDRRAIVVGAGLAGAAACERLCARGWQVTLIEQHARAATEASGNHAGIFMPVLSRDDSLATRLSRAAFLFALRYWNQLGGVGTAFTGAQCGVLHLPRDPAFAATQRAIAQAQRYPADFAQWLGAGEASAMLKSPAPEGAWWFPQGGWANPASVCEAMLRACGPRLDAHFGVGAVSLSQEAGQPGGQWQVRDGSAALLASAPVLVNAAGAGGPALAPACALPLDRVRGQVTYLPAEAVPPLSVVVCRDAYMTPPWAGVACLGASYDRSDDSSLSAASQQDNLERVGDMLAQPGLGRGLPLAGRVGWRSVAPDRLPMIGALPAAGPSGRVERLRDLPRQHGLYGLLGYASRGLTWAPLAAELLAATLDGEPLPLEASLVQAVDPGRFLLAQLRRGKP